MAPSRAALRRLQFSVSTAPGAAGLSLSSLIAHRLGGELRYQPEMTDVRFVLWLPI